MHTKHILNLNLDGYLLVSSRVIEVVPSLGSNYIGHTCERKYDGREWPPCSSKPNSSRSSHATIHKSKATIFVFGCPTMGSHCPIDDSCSNRDWAGYRDYTTILQIITYMVNFDPWSFTFLKTMSRLGFIEDCSSRLMCLLGLIFTFSKKVIFSSLNMTYLWNFIHLWTWISAKFKLTNGSYLIVLNFYMKWFHIEIHRLLCILRSTIVWTTKIIIHIFHHSCAKRTTS